MEKCFARAESLLSLLENIADALEKVLLSNYVLNILIVPREHKRWRSSMDAKHFQSIGQITWFVKCYGFLLLVGVGMKQTLLLFLRRPWYYQIIVLLKFQKFHSRYFFSKPRICMCLANIKPYEGLYGIVISYTGFVAQISVAFGQSSWHPTLYKY